MEEKERLTESAAETPENTEAAAAGSPADTVDVADSAALLANLTAERDQLAKERDDYYDRLLRRTAEFENYRRRVDRERTELMEFAGMEAVRELLPILDDFERALKVESADKEYARGMELIYQRLLEVLKKLGLEPMDSSGRTFDPHLHDAVEIVNRDDVEDHTIVEEFRRGYNFKGRLLRPAMVKVAVRQ